MSFASSSSPQRQQPYIPEFFSPSFSPAARFNPKRVTEEAETARNAVPKPPPAAPYFHIDTPPKRLSAVHVPRPVSKSLIAWTRYVNLVLRLGQLLGAMGLLVLMLLIRGVDDFSGWICRIPPGVAIAHIIYGIYHLSGSYRLRTPASGKGYHLFASIVDLAIIVFYTFIAILSWRQYAAGISNMDWRTVFNDNDTTIKLVFSVFLLACSAGGLTVLSLGANLYLVHAFRRLQSLPTDSNPYIEDDEEQLLSEKRWSGSTANSETPFLGHRTMPFAATRIANEKPMVTGGKYTYQTLSVDNFEMGGEDVRRETLGSGYGDVKNGSDHVPSYAAPSYATTVDEDERFPAPSRTNTMSSLKRTHAIRPSSIAGTLKGLKRNSYAPPPPEHGSGESGSHDLKRHSSYDPSTAVEADGHDIEGLRASVVSSGSWGSSAGVQGFSKAAMLKNVPVPEKRPDLLISKTWGSAEGVQGFSKSAMLKDVPLSENKRPGVVSSKTWGSAEGVDPFSKAAIPDDFPVPENQRASVVSSRSFGSSGGIQGFSKAAMLDEFPVSESQRASGVSSGGVQGFSKAAMLDEFPVPESHRASVVSAKSFGSSGGVQGFSKAAMLEGGVGRTRRFNKTSKEGK